MKNLMDGRNYFKNFVAHFERFFNCFDDEFPYSTSFVLKTSLFNLPWLKICVTFRNECFGKTLRGLYSIDVVIK